MKNKNTLLLLGLAAILPTAAFAAECVPPTSTHYDLNFLKQAEFSSIDDSSLAKDNELYYNCDAKTFFLGNSTGKTDALTAPTGHKLTTAEIASLQAAKGNIYFNTTTNSFVIGQGDGSTIAVEATDFRKTSAEITALSGSALAGKFYFNTESSLFYIGLQDGSLSLLIE